MIQSIATALDQSVALISCGVPPDTADCIYDVSNGRCLLETNRAYDPNNRNVVPAWSLARLLGILPVKIQSDNRAYYCSIAPLDFGEQWSIGYYSIQSATPLFTVVHNSDLIECVVQTIMRLTHQGYILNLNNTNNNDRHPAHSRHQS